MMSENSLEKSLLVCSGIGLSIGKRTVLSDCSLVLNPGELVALVGPNGAGKSSLLRSIVGLSAFTGEINISGGSRESLSANQRSRMLSYLPQNGHINWPMRVRDIVSMGRLPFMTYGAAARQDSIDAVTSIMDACKISELADRIALTLSGGERARVLLARAMVTQANILLADEPLGSLDPGHQLDTMESLRDYAAKGRGVLVVMHDIGMSLRFADRVIVMDQGRIVASGHGQFLLDSGVLEQVFNVDFEPLFDRQKNVAGALIKRLL